jgi:GNAT superfamily N-acetyltransferase
MSGYRFCRTDDIGLLVDALNRCWAPHFPHEPPMTAAAFKRSIRDLQVWCSSCMVAFSGSEPIGVLIGAKRPTATLVHKIAVHPDHLRQGHAQHMLESLASKLAILGPPRIVAEVPEALDGARQLFAESGYDQETLLTDYVIDAGREDWSRAAAPAESFIIPVTLEDLAANGLIAEDHSEICWQRSMDTLRARNHDILGFAAASEERIEAYLLYMKEAADGAATAEILAFRSLVEDAGTRLNQLLSRVSEEGIGTLRFPKVAPAEVSETVLQTLGFRRAGAYRLYAATPRTS